MMMRVQILYAWTKPSYKIGVDTRNGTRTELGFAVLLCHGLRRLLAVGGLSERCLGGPVRCHLPVRLPSERMAQFRKGDSVGNPRSKRVSGLRFIGKSLTLRSLWENPSLETRLAGKYRTEWLVFLHPSVSSRVSGFPVASPCLWGKLKNISFSKVSKQVVMSFCVAGVALCDIPTCLITCRECQNWRKSRTKCAFFCTQVSRPESLVFLWIVYGGSSALHTLHFTLHTPQLTLQTPHSTLYTLHSTLYTLHFTLFTPHSRLYTPHSTLYTPHSSLYTLHSTLYTLHSTLDILNSTLYTPHSSLPHSSLYTPHSTLLTVHSTLHTFHFALLTPRSTLCTLHSSFDSLNSTLHT